MPELIRRGASAVYDIDRHPLPELASLLAAHAEAALLAQTAPPIALEVEFPAEQQSFAAMEWDHRLAILRWSNEAEAILGIPKSDAEGRVVGKWLLPSREMIPFISGCQSLASGVLGNFKASCRVRRSDGVSLDAAWKVTPHAKKPDCFVAIFEIEAQATKPPRSLRHPQPRQPAAKRAVPARHEAFAAEPGSGETTYLQRAEFLARAVEKLSIGVYLKEEVGEERLTVWNAQMERIFQLPREAVVGRPIKEVFTDPAIRAILSDAKQPHSRSRAIVPSPAESAGGHANCIADVAKTPLHDDQGRRVAVIGIVHDVTERIQSENRLVSAFSELEASKEKLELSNLEIRKGIEKAKKLAIVAQASNKAKSFFLSNISHELRTPLTSIVSLTHALLEGTFGSMNPKQKEYLEIVSDSSRHLQALINDILDLSKIELGKLNLSIAHAPIVEIAQASVRMVMQQAQAKNVHCELSFKSAADSIDVDPKRLRQILLNLLYNAVKFTRPGTTIGLRIHTPSQGETIVFTVTDEGIGIRESDVAAIFTPFTQLDDSLSKQYEGTGLGLAIVSKLVELHGGSIAVATAVGAGASFSVTLPISQIEDAPAPEPAPSLANVATQGQKGSMAVVVEENERVARQIQATLARQGYHHALAATPTELVAFSDQVAPDFVIVDLATVASQGPVWISQVRQHPSWSQARWIATSSLDIAANHSIAQKLGFDRFLPKPITRAALDALP